MTLISRTVQLYNTFTILARDRLPTPLITDTRIPIPGPDFHITPETLKELILVLGETASLLTELQRRTNQSL